jgi:hypothetical protein
MPAARGARHLGDGVGRVGHVLEHLDRRRQGELAVGERQVLGLVDAVLDVGRLVLRPAGLDVGRLEVEPHEARLRVALRPLVDEHALAASDVEDRRGRGAAEQIVERALEAGHQSAHHRVGRAVLVVGVAGDRALGVARDGAHSFSASRSSVCPRRPARAPVVGGWPVSSAPGS